MSSLSTTFMLSGSRKQSERFTIQLLVLFSIFIFPLAAQAKYEGGTGTTGDPYLIYTAEQMNKIGANPGDWNKYFKLIANIDMNDISETDYNIIENFTGTFDGNDCTICNFSLTSTREENTGLFGSVGGNIDDLGLLNANVFSQGRAVGALIGHLDQGIIANCYVRGANVAGGLYAGGLVGLNAGRITNCYSTGTVSGDECVGGLAGYISDGTVSTCYSRADVTGNKNVGGLVGKTGKETSEVTHSYARGTVDGGVNVGGLVGQVEQGNAYKSYSTGRVSGTQYVGGLVGRKRVLGVISRSFWDTQTSGQLTCAGGTGKTTIQMKTISTYTSTGWDFWNTWTICEGINYPVFLWQIPVADFLCPDGFNFIDFALFAAHWHRNDCNAANDYCGYTDLDHSGSVNIWDLEIFAEHWLEGFD